jgi:hypothetical protein
MPVTPGAALADLKREHAWPMLRPPHSRNV